MEMILILDELLVDSIGLDPLRTKAPGKKLDEIVLKLGRKGGDMGPCVFANNEHLTKMSL